MHAHHFPALVAVALGMLVLSCSKESANPVVVNSHGYVQGHVTRNGKLASGILVSAMPSTLDTTAGLAKIHAVEGTDIAAANPVD
jgi:hypothetical protein